MINESDINYDEILKNYKTFLSWHNNAISNLYSIDIVNNVNIISCYNAAAAIIRKETQYNNAMLHFNDLPKIKANEVCKMYIKFIKNNNFLTKITDNFDKILNGTTTEAIEFGKSIVETYIKNIVNKLRFTGLINVRAREHKLKRKIITKDIRNRIIDIIPDIEELGRFKIIPNTDKHSMPIILDLENKLQMTLSVLKVKNYLADVIDNKYDFNNKLIKLFNDYYGFLINDRKNLDNRTVFSHRSDAVIAVDPAKFNGEAAFYVPLRGDMTGSVNGTSILFINLNNDLTEGPSLFEGENYYNVWDKETKILKIFSKKGSQLNSNYVGKSYYFIFNIDTNPKPEVTYNYKPFGIFKLIDFKETTEHEAEKVAVYTLIDDGELKKLYTISESYNKSILNFASYLMD